MISYLTTVKLHDVDAADRLFFSNQFKIAHDAWEEFLESLGLPLSEIIAQKKFSLPIVHAEGDYKKSVRTGYKLQIDVSVEQIGTTSFTMNFDFLSTDNQIIGKVKCVHVSIDAKNGKKIPVPSPLREKLMKHIGN